MKRFIVRLAALTLVVPLHVGIVSAQLDDSISDHIRVEKRTRIDRVVAEFNKLAADHEIGSAQPPLTSDEVLAAMLRWPHDRKIKAEEKKGYLEVGEPLGMGSVRAGARLSYSTVLRTRGIHFTVWWIDLTFEEHTFRIRDRTISSRRLTEAEKKEINDKMERIKKMKNNEHDKKK